MKFFLSSFKLGRNPEKLFELFGANKRIAIIPNAKDNYDPKYRKERLEEERNSLNNLGLIPEEVDLKDYFGREESLESVLDKFGGVWVVGGNTFVLRVAMRKSGFDKWIKEKLSDKEFVYAGYSAGICILAPTLKGLDIVDNPKEVEEVIWEGLGILDYSIAPHFRSDHPESESVEKEVEYLKKNNMSFKTLSDGDIIILEK
ncbi:MAG TPA: Type 1 glutamine amidotransferase-like domain-containing protein [Patescibacteria group bacterium]